MSATAAGTDLYTRHFGLKREPFSIAPDPRYLFMSEHHREALAHLLYGVRGGGGFVLLTGEIGAGKTTLCRCFLEQVPKGVNVAYILNPKLSVVELLASICEEFHVTVPPLPPSGRGVKPLVDALNHYLLRAHAAGQNNVVIIDEAQNVSVRVLEHLRLLTNLETSERKLLQIILIGQPELRKMLEQPQLEQLAQRIVARYHLRALSADDTARYVRHRLSVAGIGPQQPFSKEVLQIVHEVSRGIPRRINLLCDRALLGAYAKGQAEVTAATVERSAQEVFGQPAPSAKSRSRRLRIQQALTLLGAGLLLGLAAAAMVVWWNARKAPTAPAPASQPTPRITP